MNELHKESSPYLLQHKANPIFWKSWNDISLAQAQKENKLIIISVGYSACHWCHVMEHESFQDKQVATLMNKYFVNIKVDREERPDIDAIYMKAVQLMTKQGGWPLNVVALPDGKPIWGGTYFRKEEWLIVLEQLAVMWEEEPQKMLEYADNLKNALDGLNQIIEQPILEDQKEVFDALLQKWELSFDWEFGGYTRAPKFMMPSNYQFLMRYAHQQKDKKLLEYVNLTLTKMAFGGIFDVIDGGFSRYSVDMKWHVPHFEKMLYDNGQLVSLYSNAYKLTKNPLYKEVVQKTLSFVEREWLSDEGGFFAAYDADSLNSKGFSEEGAFYVWKKEELQAIFTDDFSLFAAIFSIDDFGHWEEDKYVLIQQHSLENTAKSFGISVEEVQEKKKFFEQELFRVRENRVKPALDDKILTSWNAIMNRGFTDAYKAFGEPKYLEIAVKNADFLRKKLWSEKGNLYRSYKSNTAKINGFLEDYAWMIDALIGLYEVTANQEYIVDAKQLTDFSLDHFYDSQKGLFRFKSVMDLSLVSENFEIEDNVIDSSNSVMAENLYTLSIYFGQTHYQDIYDKMMRIVISNIDYPSAFSNWLNGYLNLDTTQRELAICGENAIEHLRKINAHYFPNLSIAATEKESHLPFLKGKFSAEVLQFFVCQNKVCHLPLQKMDEVINILS